MVQDPQHSLILPIELSSLVTALESVTRELMKKLNRDDVTLVIKELCARLLLIPGEQRGPNRPFSG